MSEQPAGPAPLLTADPRAGFLAHESGIRDAIDRVLRGGRYILGPEVEAFEAEFAAYQGGGKTVGVANGTEALELALRAVGVKPGQHVVTVANTVSATIAAIEQIGARPVFIEIDPDTLQMDPRALDVRLRLDPGSIAAVVPVHLYGHLADMPAILEAAGRHDVPVIEDCAQAHGASLHGRKAGTWGALAAFSFYPTKNLGALGDAGAVYSTDPELVRRVELLRQYGWRSRYISEEPGRNSRLDELQAAILRVKLPHLDAENARRSRLVSRYLERLQGSGLRLPSTAPGCTPCWHQFTVRHPDRDALRDQLARTGILAAALYPVPAHKQPAYAHPGCTLPRTEEACAQVLSLPCHPWLEDADVDRVSDEILRWSHP